jgi:hypothetical protein
VHCALGMWAVYIASEACARLVHPGADQSGRIDRRAVQTVYDHTMMMGVRLCMM